MRDKMRMTERKVSNWSGDTDDEKIKMPERISTELK